MGKRSRVSLDEMRDWLRRYEIGDPIERIAKEATRDTRTVLRYLAQARKEADLRAARQNLLTQALTKHNDEMLKVVTNIIQALEVPNAQVEIRQDEQGNWQDIQLTAAKGLQTTEGTRIELHDEGAVSWRLLAEHLGVDSLLERISVWKKPMADYLDTMKAFKLSIAETMRTKTGLDMIKETHEKPVKPALFQAVKDTLFPIFVNRAMNVPDGTDPEHNLKIDQAGYVSIKGWGTHLGWLSKEGNPLVDKMLEALNELGQSQEFRQLKSSYHGIQQITRKFRDEFEEISLVGYIAGRCRVCERLEK